jgi:hypothetical protein
MAAKIRIKRSETSGNPSTLAAGELAYSGLTYNGSNGGDRLYIGLGVETNGDAANHLIIGGKYYTDLLGGASNIKGTLTANSAILVDANKKIDNLIIDNIDINGNTISTTNANGNLVLAPDGNGGVSVSSKKIIDLATPTNGTDAATKAYVDEVVGASFFTYTGDTGTDTLNLKDSSLSVLGGTGLTSIVSNNQILFNLDSTAVTPGSYGSATQIPTFTVDAQGRLTAASFANVATTLTINGDGATTDTVSLLDSNLTFTGGTGITTTVTNNTVTINGDNATTSSKGIAQFSSDNFAVSSGLVTIKDGGIANAELVNSTITLGSSTLTLGATTTAIAGITQLDVDNIRIDGNTISSTDGSNIMFIDPAPTDSDGGDLIIRGNLTVQGTTTTINSTIVSINDLNLVLADSATSAAAADGAGITVNGANATITYDASTNRWDLNKALDLPDSIGAALFFNGTPATEAIEDHLVNNTFLAGEGIDLTYDDNANTLTFAAELATITNPGVASFDSDQFTVTSGAVTIYNLDGGIY